MKNCSVSFVYVLQCSIEDAKHYFLHCSGFAAKSSHDEHLLPRKDIVFK